MGAPFMWILKKKYDYWWKKYGLEKTDAQGDENFAFWQKLGDFIETKANKSPTSPGLVIPDYSETCLNRTSLGPTFEFGIDRCSV
jgi:hypothetical protein